jgi:hypothetical protein
MSKEKLKKTQRYNLTGWEYIPSVLMMLAKCSKKNIIKLTMKRNDAKEKNSRSVVISGWKTM